MASGQRALPKAGAAGPLGCDWSLERNGQTHREIPNCQRIAVGERTRSLRISSKGLRRIGGPSMREKLIDAHFRWGMGEGGVRPSPVESPSPSCTLERSCQWRARVVFFPADAVLVHDGAWSSSVGMWLPAGGGLGSQKLFWVGHPHAISECRGGPAEQALRRGRRPLWRRFGIETGAGGFHGPRRRVDATMKSSASSASLERTVSADKLPPIKRKPGQAAFLVHRAF